MGLKRYKAKRNFKETPEPSGHKAGEGKQLRFVIQRHNASHLHYDFRLEMENVLKSWAVPKGPSLNPNDKRLAVMVEDHPVEYGKFKGIIPEGNYGAGTVEIWDNGTYSPLEKKENISDEKELLNELKKGDLKFVLNGKKLKGAFALVQMHQGDGKNWLLIKKKDKYTTTGNYSIEDVKPLIPLNEKEKQSTVYKKKNLRSPKDNKQVKKKPLTQH
jgi:bifunctional non-homologous end joining protein LigD